MQAGCKHTKLLCHISQDVSLTGKLAVFPTSSKGTASAARGVPPAARKVPPAARALYPTARAVPPAGTLYSGRQFGI